MKEIKWILYTLYVVGYTSLAWVTIIWNGIPIGPNDIVIGIIGLIFLTIINIVVITSYIYVNWNQG